MKKCIWLWTKIHVHINKYCTGVFKIELRFDKVVCIQKYLSRALNSQQSNKPNLYYAFPVNMCVLFTAELGSYDTPAFNSMGVVNFKFSTPTFVKHIDKKDDRISVMRGKQLNYNDSVIIIIFLTEIHKMYALFLTTGRSERIISQGIISLFLWTIFHGALSSSNQMNQ